MYNIALDCHAVYPLSAVLCGTVYPPAVVLCGTVYPSAFVLCGTVYPPAVVLCGTVCPPAIVLCGTVYPPAVVLCGTVYPPAVVLCGTVYPSAFVLCGTVYPPAVVLCGTVCPLCHAAQAAILYCVAQSDVCCIYAVHSTRCVVFPPCLYNRPPPPSLRQAVSDAELLSYYDRLLEHRPRLEAFSVLRAALAPVIEAVILLDRLVYLLEQVCHTAGPAGPPAGTGVSYCWTG